MTYQAILDQHVADMQTRRLVPSKHDPSNAVRRPKYKPGKQIIPLAPLGELHEGVDLVPVEPAEPAEDVEDVNELIESLYPVRI